MPSKASRHHSLQRNTVIVQDFCHKYDLKLEQLNNGYQLRIEGVLDIYPVRGRWHNLTTHERGSWFTDGDLHNIMLKAVEVQIPPVKWPPQAVKVDVEPASPYDKSPFGEPVEVTAAEQTLTLDPLPFMKARPLRREVRQRLRWIIRTFTGYKVVLVTKDGAYSLVHRPFRAPIRNWQSNPQQLRGQRSDMLILDEYATFPAGDSPNKNNNKKY